MRIGLGIGLGVLLGAPPAGTPPEAPTLTAPTAATAMVYVGQGVTVSATTTDGDLDEMRWIVDDGGGEVEVASDATSPYSTTWTVAEDVAVYTLVARAVRAGLTTDSAPLTVYVMPAAPIWIRAQDYADGAITDLVDKGPGGVDFTGTATVVDAVLGGKKVLRANGTTNRFDSANVDWTGTPDCTVVVVYAETAGGNQGTIVTKAATPTTDDEFDLNFGYPGANYMTVVSKHASSARAYESTADGALGAGFHLLQFVVDQSQASADEMKLYDGASEVTLDDAGDVDSSGNFANSPITIFARGNGTQHLTGDLAELLIWPGDLTAGELAVVRAGLTAFYSL